eukprot:GILI01013290.1.p1 GENE.GILI01013290.1~~GILI01013290.1.p1  ORF type:complete len:238 (+),score=48.57 GILI01013290.1:51-764(+)
MSWSDDSLANSNKAVSSPFADTKSLAFFEPSTSSSDSREHLDPAFSVPSVYLENSKQANAPVVAHSSTRQAIFSPKADVSSPSSSRRLPPPTNELSSNERYTEIDKQNLVSTKILLENYLHSMRALLDHLEHNESGLPTQSQSLKNMYKGDVYTVEGAIHEFKNPWLERKLMQYMEFIDVVSDGTWQTKDQNFKQSLTSIRSQSKASPSVAEIKDCQKRTGSIDLLGSTPKLRSFDS